MLMSIITLLIVLIILGFGLWLINTYIPMQPPIKIIINVIVVIILLLWLLQAVGVSTGVSHLRL
jgi:hypothetical protein